MTPKLKKGTRHLHPTLGEVTIEHDREDGKVNVRHENGFELVNKTDLSEVNKLRKPIQLHKKPNADDKRIKSDLTRFYLQISYDMPFNCQECGRPLNAHNSWAKRTVSCHILPKSLFPEIATVEANIIFMGSSLFSACSHHNIYDEKDASYRKSMKIYTEILSRYHHFLKPLLSGPQQVKAEKYLGIV